MSEIDFEFATKDDCLQKMVPSDLRVIISERDKLREEKVELLEMLESCAKSLEYHQRWVLADSAWAVIAKAKGEQE